MKINMNIGLLIGLCLLFQVIGVLSAPANQVTNDVGRDRNEASYYEELAKECGDLGVMVVPDGTNENEIRHCANHPLGRNRDTTGMTPVAESESDKRAEADLNNELDSANFEDNSPATIFGRDDQVCNYGPPYGCQDTYCWRNCGAGGRWCWIAEGNGGGPWRRCKWDYDCRPETGGSCGVGCVSCGCSC